MTKPGKIHLTLYLFALIGAALFIFLLMQHGFKEITSAVAAVGWGLLIVTVFHLLVVLADAIGWHVLYPAHQCPKLSDLFWSRWVDEAVTNLLPSIQIGGDIVRARLSHLLSGVPVAFCAGTVLVDLTIGVVMQAVITVIGLGMLAHATGQSFSIGAICLGLLITAIALGGFYAVQRYGMFHLVSKMVARLSRSESWHSLVKNAAAVDQAVRSTYGQPKKIFVCAIWSLAAWMGGAIEVWISLYFIDPHAAAFSKAMIFESLGMGIRSVMFFVPGALGVQEGGYLFIGEALGISASNSLVLALIRRVRDLGTGIPGLLIWQIAEGRHLLGINKNKEKKVPLGV